MGHEMLFVTLHFSDASKDTQLDHSRYCGVVTLVNAMCKLSTKINFLSATVL